jgi:hypothetical protein
MKWWNIEKYKVSGSGIVQLFLSLEEEIKLPIGI